MIYNRLGGTDLTLSALGMGCSQIASLSTRHPPREIRAALEKAVDRGINFFDTADVYGQGDSERMLARLMRQRRETIYVATKAGMTIGGSQGAIRVLKPLLAPVARRMGSVRRSVLQSRQAGEGRCWEPRQLRQRIEESIRRLGVGRLDLFLLHSPSPADLEDGKLYDLLDALRDQGLVRHHGVSVNALADVPAIVGQGRAACLQVPLDATTLDTAAPALDAARAKGMGVIAREIFAGARLASRGSPDDIAEAAIAPFLRRNDVDVALVGATCRRHLDADLNVLERLKTGTADHDGPTC